MLTDDDEILVGKYPEVIKFVFENTMISVARFAVKGIETEFKKYDERPYNIGYLNLLKIFYIEFAFRKEEVVHIMELAFMKKHDVAFSCTAYE